MQLKNYLGKETVSIAYTTCNFHDFTKFFNNDFYDFTKFFKNDFYDFTKFFKNDFYDFTKFFKNCRFEMKAKKYQYFSKNTPFKILSHFLQVVSSFGRGYFGNTCWKVYKNLFRGSKLQSA